MIKDMNSLHKQERGIVAIFSMLIIMAILSLVAVGFSNVTREAERRALDNQLNNQAFYAAESGINDARAYLKANPDVTAKQACQNSSLPNEANYFNGYDNKIDEGLEVGYSCVLINDKIQDLKFTAVPLAGAASPKTAPVESGNNGVVQGMKFTWSGDADTQINTSGNGSSNSLLGKRAWGSSLGMLRVDLVPTEDNGNPNAKLSRDNMESRAYTFFLYPSNNAGSPSATVSAGENNQGAIISARCSTGPACSITIDLSGSSSSKYVVRLQGLYNPSDVTISELRAGGSSGVMFANAQIMIDSTGRANEVYRRVQVRLPKTGTGRIPDFALLSADTLCKRIIASDAGLGVDDAGLELDQDDLACAVANPVN